MKQSDSRPRVLVTREDPMPVSRAVQLAGGHAIELPLLVTRWLEFDIPEGRALSDYDWVAFTSARAVEALRSAATARGWRWPPAAAGAAVGNRTAHELQARGWMPRCVAAEASASGLVACLREQGVDAARVLFPCSAIADETFPKGMREAGAVVDVVHVYTTETPWTQAPERKAELAAALATCLQRGCVATCASPSAVRALHELATAGGVLDALRATPVVALGRTTARAVDALHLQSIDAGGRSLACLARKAVEVARTLSS